MASMTAHEGDERESARSRLEALLAARDLQAAIDLLDMLEARIDAQTARADAAVEEADSLGERVRKLDARVKWLTRLVFGRRSEKLRPEDLRQLSLALGGDGSNETPVPGDADTRTDEAPPGESPKVRQPKKRRKNHHGRRPLPPDLERVVVGEVRVPDEERACTHCGEPMCTFDWVEHETVERISARFEVHVERREKVSCRTKACPGEAVTADRGRGPALPTRVGASVLVDLVERKCDDSLPIYRLRDEYARHGFDVPLNTLYGYWTYETDLLLPVADVTLGVVLDDEVVSADDTGMPVLDKSKPSGKFRGHLWGFQGSSTCMVAFQFTETWEATEVQPWIEAISGFIQVDDYKGYSARVESLSEPGKLITLVPEDRRLGCMMHVRRGFYDAFKAGDERAAPAIDFIRKIYEVEAEAKARELDPEGRLALRQEKSISVLADFFEWIEGQKPKLGKTSKLAEAVRYAENQRSFIERCFTDGRFEIDNGAIERTLKKPCVGRKNYLHCGSVQGAKRLAAAYTLVLSAKNLGLNVREYLIDVTTKLANGWPLTRLRELVPDAWAAARASAPASAPTGQPGQ